MANDQYQSADIDKFSAQLRKFAKWINEKSVNVRLARKCKEIIYRRVKSGKGVNKDSGDPEQTEAVALLKLSKSYKDYRNGLAVFRTMPNGHVVRFDTSSKVAIEGKKRKFKRKGEVVGIRRSFNHFKTVSTTESQPTLGEFGRPDKSNLTLTGQMLNALVMSSDENGFTLTVNNKLREDGLLTNRQVANYVSSGGSFVNGNGKTVKIPARPFLALTSGEIRIITSELEKIIREIIEKNIR